MSQPATTPRSRKVQVVFVEYETSGRHGSVHSAPLHEIIVIREKVRADREDLIVHDVWPEHVKSFQIQARSLAEEHQRLSLGYDAAATNQRPFYTQVYGQASNSRLERIITRIHELFLQGVKPSKLIELGRPDSEFIEWAADVPAAATVAALDQPADPASVPAVRQDPAPGAPEGAGEKYSLPDAPDPVALDGKLVDHLEDAGWDAIQSREIARLMVEAAGQPINDADLKKVRGITNQAALKKVREHLATFDATRSS